MTGGTSDMDVADQLDRVTVRDLGRISRGLFAVAGLSGLIAGGFAVFQTDNQAGSVALLAVGSIASLLAVVGKVPLKWVIGGNEFDMSESAAREAADAVASQLTPAQTAELLGKLANSDAGRPSQMTLAVADYVSFEQSAIAKVAEAVARVGWSFVSADRSAPFDGYVSTDSGAQVPIEFKLVRGGHPTRRIREHVTQLQRVAASDLVLVLGGVKLDRNTVEGALSRSDGPRVQLVFAEDEHFDRSLLAAIDRALSASGT